MLQRPRGESLHSDFNTQSRSNLLQAGPRIAGPSNGGQRLSMCLSHGNYLQLIMKSSGPYYKAHPLTIVLPIMYSPLRSEIANYTCTQCITHFNISPL